MGGEEGGKKLLIRHPFQSVETLWHRFHDSVDAMYHRFQNVEKTHFTHSALDMTWHAPHPGIPAEGGYKN